MANTFVQLYTHIIVHVHPKSPTIDKDEEKHLHAYIASVITSNNSIPIVINGTENHVHILCSMSMNQSVAHLVDDIKKNSYRWLRDQSPAHYMFRWQEGYAAFSVSASQKERTAVYIRNQREIHQKFSFQKEYEFLLEQYGIAFNENLLWS